MLFKTQNYFYKTRNLKIKKYQAKFFVIFSFTYISSIRLEMSNCNYCIIDLDENGSEKLLNIRINV